MSVRPTFLSFIIYRLCAVCLPPPSLADLLILLKFIVQLVFNIAHGLLGRLQYKSIETIVVFSKLCEKCFIPPQALKNIV